MSSDNPYGDIPPQLPNQNPYASPGGTMKPGGFPPGRGPMGPPPKNYLVESILLLVCCSGLLAIPAIVYAAQVNGKHAAGDVQGAMVASENAKKWCLIALCVGILCNSLAIGVQVIPEL